MRALCTGRPSPERGCTCLNSAAGNVNGFQMPRSLSEDDFRQVFPDAGWEITYLGPTTYLINMSVETLELMVARNPEMADQVTTLV